MSILVCVIGCLTMIIVFINLIQMNQVEGKEPEEVEVAKEYVEVEKKQEEDQKKLDELRQLMENLIQDQEDLRSKREKLRRLKELLASNEQIDSLRDELIAKLNQLLKMNKSLEADKEELLAELAKLKKEIEQRKLPPEAPALRVRSSGSSTNVEPYFVEIADKTILIHTSLTEPPVEIPSASLKASKDFLDLLKKIAEKPYRKLILLVRGNEASVANYNRVKSTVTGFNRVSGANILPGKLPLPGEGKVDLTVFVEFLK